MHDTVSHSKFAGMSRDVAEEFLFTLLRNLNLGFLYSG